MPEKRKNKIKYFSKSQLKERGWTETAINKFLGNWDLEKKNPMYSSSSTMKLYLIKRVKRAESTKKFKQWSIDRDKRRLAALKSIKTKEDKLVEIVKSWNIQIDKISYKKILRYAIDDYNDFKLSKNDTKSLINNNTNKEILDRVCVNFIRHQLSDYDGMLYELSGRTGISKAYLILNQKIYDTISEIYPRYKNECTRQLNDKEFMYNTEKEIKKSYE